MGANDEPVFVFGLGLGVDEIGVFASRGEASAYIGSWLFSESLARNVFRAKPPRLQVLIYTISGQPLVLAKSSRFGVWNFINDGPPDDAGLQSRLDTCAASRGLSVPVADRVALANQLMREGWERTRANPPPMPRWLAKRLPEPRSEPPQIS